MTRRNDRFHRFQTPTFTCAVCKRRTRDTGQGVDHLCEDDYELAGMDNHCNDNGVTAEQAGYVAEMDRRLARIAALGGDASQSVKQNSYLFAGYTKPVPATKVKAPRKPKPAKPVPPTPAYMVPVVERTPEAVSERLKGFVDAAQKMIDERNAREFPNLPYRTVLELNLGQRYAKINARDQRDGALSGGSVWAFIDLTTGDILKPASWRAPAKGVRGTILAANYGVGSCTAHGPRYL